MHEWALAESVIFTATKEAKKENLEEITMIKVKVGELQQIDLEIFRFALSNFLKTSDYLLDMTRIEIEIEKCILKCRVCRNEWGFYESLKKLPEAEAESIHFIPEVAHIYIRCPGCGSPDFEITDGRGVWIDYIIGER
ncbi:MAG: hydrogenase nickel incorporation protein HypA [Desulfotomaculaceae bacterium]|nr:hydrogenase nickel incorporation protein HypA [Desulfotomaculaceae bacterium]